MSSRRSDRLPRYGWINNLERSAGIEDVNPSSSQTRTISHRATQPVVILADFRAHGIPSNRAIATRNMIASEIRYAVIYPVSL